MSVGSMFQAAGPATLNARSPNFSDVRGMSKALLSADRRLEYGQTLSIFAIPRTPDTSEMLLAAAGNPRLCK